MSSKATDKAPFAENDRVCLVTDPAKAGGVVVEELHKRFLVRWDTGRSWIYAAVELQKEGT